MYTHAILKKPCHSLKDGLTTASLGEPDFDLACAQHTAYTEALIKAGLEVTMLEADEGYPDSVFVEDVALCLADCAIATHPGAPSREGEVDHVRRVLHQYFDKVHHITAPGTLDGGDVLEVEDHYYIGLSQRTNQEGADQLIQILNYFGATGSVVPFEDFLHLKSGVSYLGDDVLLVAEQFERLPSFAAFERLVVPADEAYAANAVRVNDYVLVAAGFPATHDLLSGAGYNLITLEMSEFQKVDGGLSCLSLRF